MRDILLFVITGSLSAGALIRPVVGMLAYIAYSFIGPHSYTWGPARSFPHAQVLAVCTLVGFLVSSEAKSLPRQRELIFFLILWGVFGVTTAVAQYPERSFEFFVHISKIFLMIVVCMSLMRTEERVHLLAKTIALSVGFYGLKGGVFVLQSGGVAPIEGPDNSYLQANNALGMAIAMNAPLLFYLAKVEPNQWLRWLMRGMFACSYPAVAGTFSRGAWVGLGIVTMVLVLKSGRLWVKLLAGVAVVIAITVVIPNITSDQISARFNTFNKLEEDSSSQQRLWTWTFCSRVGSALPLSGAGFDYYSIEAYARFYPEFLERWPGRMYSCHSMWLTIFGEHGVPGIVAWSALMLSCFLSLRWMKRTGSKLSLQQWVKPYSEMIQLSVLAYMVCGTFVDIAYFEMYYFLIALLILTKDRISLQSSVDMAREARGERDVLDRNREPLPA